MAVEYAISPIDFIPLRTEPPTFIAAFPKCEVRGTGILEFYETIPKERKGYQS